MLEKDTGTTLSVAVQISRSKRNSNALLTQVKYEPLSTSGVVHYKGIGSLNDKTTWAGAGLPEQNFICFHARHWLEVGPLIWPLLRRLEKLDFLDRGFLEVKGPVYRIIGDFQGR
jgi:hypothetical protein